MKIAVFGIGYVGLSIAILLAQQHEVVMVDVIPEKINMINNRKSPISDEYIEKYMKNTFLNLKATSNPLEAYNNADYVVIAVPTNFNQIANSFNTSIVESIICNSIEICPNALIIIKSTIPIGFTQRMNYSYHSQNIVFCPEFLRESTALYDNLYPSRIIIGHDITEQAILQQTKKFVSLLVENALKKDITILYMNSKEAESVKLFSNTYLALRVSFFNELDTFAEINNLNAFNIIQGVCSDSRIGDYYNNPSFGYGGYCLPKDTNQLLSCFEGIPQEIITAVVKSNKTRLEYIVDTITSRCSLLNVNKEMIVIGIYKLSMKSSSDNFRNSAIIEVMNKLKALGFSLQIYEPIVRQDSFCGVTINHDINEFKQKSTIIITNRYDKQLEDSIDKVYTRDLFGYN